MNLLCVLNPTSAVFNVVLCPGYLANRERLLVADMASVGLELMTKEGEF